MAGPLDVHVDDREFQITGALAAGRVQMRDPEDGRGRGVGRSNDFDEGPVVLGVEIERDLDCELAPAPAEVGLVEQLVDDLDRPASKVAAIDAIQSTNALPPPGPASSETGGCCTDRVSVRCGGGGAGALIALV